MDKTGFLKELKQHLAVLNEGEQKDIMDEYAQHIDMKMERGMSESEAIRDFGDIGELASEILEAYHVNPQYGAKKHAKFTRKEEIPVADIAKTGRKFWFNAAGFFKKACGKVEAGFAGLWRAVKKPFQMTRDVWQNRPGLKSGTSTRRPAKEDAGVRRMKMLGEIPGMAARGIWKMFMVIVYLAAWCVRWAWNVLMMFVAFVTGAMLLGTLFSLGVLVVLLVQGYPLAGFTLGFLGLALCSGALTAIAICLCRFAGTKHPDRSETEYEEAYMDEMIIEEVPEHA